MEPLIHLDYETKCRQDLRKVGAYRYASDPSCRTLVFSIARDDEAPLTWYCHEFLEAVDNPDLWIESREAAYLLVMAIDKGWLIYAHNAQFEIAISRYRMEKDIGIKPPPLHVWRCTAAMARCAALPASLEKVAIALGLQQRKDKSGSALIRKFSIKMDDFTKEENWADFIDFGLYCAQDIHTERAVHHALKPFELKGLSLATFQVDKIINDRGIPVNVEALWNAKEIIDKIKVDSTKRFRELTGLNPTQRDKVLAWLQSKGYPADNMRAATVKRCQKTSAKWALTPEAEEALDIKSRLSFVSVGKVDSMLNCECGDGYVRGCHVYHGAGTGRWSARLIQPQNFKRPTMKGMDIAYQMLCDGTTAEELELMFGNPIEVISSCIRHFIQLPGGQKLLDSDFAAVEARIVCWLAGQEDALEEYRAGVDRYVSMAAIIFAKAAASITKDERWLGKQTVLGCGFSMGSARFFEQAYDLARDFNITGVKVTQELAELSVGTWRRQHPFVVKLWRDCEKAARNAILNPGKRFTAGPFLWFAVTEVNGIPFLVMCLPSGRKIVWAHPKLEKDEKYGKVSITFWGQIPGKAIWGRAKTYGGMLVENATQAVAADLMANGAITAEARGFEILTLIHDQSLAKDNGKDIEEFNSALCALPDWAKGLPVVAEGQKTPYYIKG